METKVSLLQHRKKELQLYKLRDLASCRFQMDNPPNLTPKDQKRNEPLAAPRSPASDRLHRSWQEHWCELSQSQNFSLGYEIQHSTVKYILEICHFSWKKLEVVSPSPPQWREALHIVCNTSKYLFQTKYFPHETSQPKTWRKPWYIFTSEMTVLAGKNKRVEFCDWERLLHQSCEMSEWSGQKIIFQQNPALFARSPFIKELKNHSGFFMYAHI